MNRRQFFSSGALATTLSASSSTAAPAAAPKRALMKLGATVMGGGPAEGARGGGERGAAATPPGEGRCARGGRAPRDPEQGFKSLGRWGVRNVVARAQIADGRLYATVDELKRLTDTAAKYDLTVDVLDPPFLPSSHIDRERNPAIHAGRESAARPRYRADPDHDQELRRGQNPLH